ncbi:MAG: phosphatase PAP2 family protein [bacterium]|nr:phosphatase PAP2 family protein [bacterium]
MEFEIVNFFNQLAAGWIDPATIFVSSNTLLGILGIIITGYFLIWDKKNGKQIAVAAVIAVGLHFLTSEIFFKYILPEFGLFRLRPYLAHPGELIPLGKLNTSSSFPSSHMAYILSLSTVYVYYYRKFLLPAAAFALFMAFARIHNGMHYPSDVLAGAVLGVLYGIMAIKISKKYAKKDI